MARKPTLTGHTNAHTLATFTDALRTLNQFTDPSAERRHAVLVDGGPLGKRPGEIRYPGSSFYEQTFLEANAVAHLAVNLGLDRRGVVDVRRRLPPQPDIELTVDGVTVAYIEETMVMDQEAHKVTLAIDQLNDAIADCEEPAVRAALDTGTLTIRLNYIPNRYYSIPFPVDALFEEICAFVRSLNGQTSVMVNGGDFALLGEMKAGAKYLARGKTSNPVSLIEHGRAGVLSTAFAEQIRKKRVKAAKYPQECRPLWLLLDIEMHFGWRVDTDPLLAIIADGNPVEFDRVIVQQARGEPLIIEFPASLNRSP